MLLLKRGDNMHILIIDDDEKFIQELTYELSSFLESVPCNYRIDSFYKNFSTIELNQKYELAFFDIDLGNANGIKLAEFMKKENTNMTIVFISSKNNLVFDTFVVNPFFFIRKTHFQKDIVIFFELFKKLLNKTTYILLDKRYSKKMVPVDSIVYVESKDHKLIIYTMDQVYFCNDTLKEFINRLPVNQFSQIHRSFIINWNYVDSIGGYSISISKGIELPIGRKYKDNIMNMYQEFLISV